MYACFIGNVEIAKLLLSRGASVNVSSSDGKFHKCNHGVMEATPNIFMGFQEYHLATPKMLVL